MTQARIDGKRNCKKKMKHRTAFSKVKNYSGSLEFGELKADMRRKKVDVMGIFKEKWV